MTEASEAQRKEDHINPEGLALIMEMEGCRLHSYQDIVGVWTIGYGHTGPEVGPGLVWTKEQVKAALAEDLDKFEQGVLAAIGDAPTSDNEFAAMVSLAYNIGEGGPATHKGFYNSTVARLHASGYTEDAAKAFEMYCRAGGQRNAALLGRRKREAALYLKPSSEKPEPIKVAGGLHAMPPPKEAGRGALIDFLDRLAERFGL